MTGKEENKDEQQFTIQPHPATTNDPHTDPALAGSQQGAGLGPGPHVPSKDVAEGLEAPKSREQLKSDAAALNKA